MVFKKLQKLVSLDGFVVLTLMMFAPVYFFKLGQSSLVSFDEAWYAQISRNVLKSNNIFELWWNGIRFYDHPPAGFWATAAVFKFFGISNFMARFTQALSGILGVVFTYFLGKELFGKRAGFLAAVSLTSSSWYLFRARSGNLDVILTFLFILTIFLAVKVNKNKKYLNYFALSFAALTLTKTLVPFTILPSLIIIFYRTKKIKLRDLRVPFLLYIIPVALWFIFSVISFDAYLTDKFFGIGLPGVGKQTDYYQNLLLAKTYLHNGIGRWFWPGVLGIFLGLTTLKKKFFVLGVFSIVFFIPFLLTDKGHIWHLIPLHPFMILSFFGFSFYLLDRLKISKPFGFLALLVFSVYISAPQLNRSWNEFIDIPAFVSDEEILSEEAAKYEGELYIDGDFVPSAIFYSDKKVNQVQIRVEGIVRDLFDGSEHFTFVTYQQTLDEGGINPQEYEIIKTDRDKILVRSLN